MKMSNLLRNRPQNPFNIKITDINTENIDKFVAYADKHQMPKRGHVMIWYKQIPSWLEEEVPNWTAQQVYDFSKSYILALSSFSSVKIDEWDIINEAITKNDFRRNTWYDIVSSQKNDEGDIGFKPYFVKLFKWARQADADVELFYND